MTIGLARGSRWTAIGSQVCVHDEHAHFLRRDSHFFGNDQAHDGDKSLPQFGGRTAHFECAIFVEFHIRTRFIGRAAAEARVLVSRGKAPGAHQIRVEQDQRPA